MTKVILFIFAFFTFSLDLAARSSFRKKDKDLPKITIGWKHSKKAISLANWALTEYPIFNVFSEAGYDFFYNHILPTDFVSDINNPEQLINCRALNLCIELLLRE